jgi:hypothetical protein
VKGDQSLVLILELHGVKGARVLVLEKSAT